MKRVFFGIIPKLSFIRCGLCVLFAFVVLFLLFFCVCYFFFNKKKVYQNFYPPSCTIIILYCPGSTHDFAKRLC